MQIVCWGTKRPINLSKILKKKKKNNPRVQKTTLLSLTKTTAPCGDKPDCSYKNGLSIDVLKKKKKKKTDHEYVYVSRVSPLSEMQFVNK